MAVHILQFKLQVGNTLMGSLGLCNGVLRILLLIVKSAAEVLFFLLKFCHLVEKVSTLIFGHRLVLDYFGMLCLKALNPTLEPFPLGN
jgi:hypothetical protein